MTGSLLTVLLIEDNPTDVLLLRAALDEDGLDRYAVVVAETLCAGLAQVAQGAFDVVLLDLGLPDSQGLGTFEAFQAAAPHLPVVVFSGNHDTRAAVAAVERGAQDYLVKGLVAWELAPRAIRYAIARQRTEQELRDLNRTLEARVAARTAEVQDLYDNAPCGYHSLDGEGRFVHVNATMLRWLGRSRAEVLGHQFSEFVDARGQAAFVDEFPQLIARGWVKDIEFDFVRPDGVRQPVILSATALYDAAGNFVMSRSTTFDMLARRQAAEALALANAELARALRVKDEFLANMSHELRTPLNTILVAREVLGEEVVGPLNARQQRYLDTIEMSGRHLLSLINDILDLAKIDAEQMALDLERTNVDELCRACLLFVKEQALRKEQTVSYRIEPPAIWMAADVRRVKQMLINLLTNAVKFTPAGGQVRLEVIARADAGVVEFAVQDTGIGIAPDDRIKLFKPFIQLDSSLARSTEGTGLGLALVHRLAAIHGGRVEVESEGIPGRGSRFTLTLPLDLEIKSEGAGA